jgi:hypothetical protein
VFIHIEVLPIYIEALPWFSEIRIVSPYLAFLTRIVAIGKRADEGYSSPEGGVI